MNDLKILDLGCGKNKTPGSIGVDFNKNSHADIIHNLDQFPYPFKNDEFDFIVMDNALEHLQQPIKVMEEIYRLLKKGGTVKVIVPYFRSVWAFIDPTHKNFFTVDSFMYFDPDNFYFNNLQYTNATFKVNKIRFNEGLKNNVLKKFLSIFANKYKRFYEYNLSHIFPLDSITYYLTKI